MRPKHWQRKGYLMSEHGNWGSWLPHDGSGTPVPFGTRVEVQTLPPYGIMNHCPTRAIGHSGIDFVNSWYWGVSDRLTLSYLPIDLYRVWSPRGARRTARFEFTMQPHTTPAPENLDERTFECS
jgi:hypothetical protein